MPEWRRVEVDVNEGIRGNVDLLPDLDGGDALLGESDVTTEALTEMYPDHAPPPAHFGRHKRGCPCNINC